MSGRSVEHRCGGIVAALWALGILATAGAAVAQPSQAQIGAVKSNCRSDYMRHCSSVTPGGAEALNCLQNNAPRLSGACRAAVDALKPPAAAAAPKPAPAPEPAAAPAPAAAPPPAPERAAAPPPETAPAKQPTRTAKPAPAPAPAAAPKQPTAQQQAAIRQSCQSDFMSRCRGVQPGGADALHCLQRNAAQLSPACRGAVASLGGGGTPAATPASAPAAAPAPEFVYTPMPPLLPRVQLGIMRACDGDRQAVCSMVPLGGGRVIDCLARNEPSLSPYCRQTLSAARASAAR